MEYYISKLDNTSLGLSQSRVFLPTSLELRFSLNVGHGGYDNLPLIEEIFWAWKM